MGSITWSGSFNRNSAGTSGLTTSVYSGSTLPANAVINSITCSVNVSAGWTNNTFYWTLHWFHVLYGNTTGAYIGTIGTNNSAGVSYQCSNVYSGGASRDVTATLSSSNKSVFENNYLTVNVKANIPQSGSPRTYMNSVYVTVNYTELSLNAPTNFRVGGSSSYTGTFGRFTWDGASWSDGGSHGNISYRIVTSDGIPIFGSDVSSGHIPDVETGDNTFVVYIEAYSGSYTARGGSVTFYYRAPTTPILTFSNGSTTYTGASAVLNWTASAIVGSQSSGATVYYIVQNVTDGYTHLYSGVGRTCTYSDSSLSQGATKKFRVYAYTSSPAVTTSEFSSEITFTYDPRQISAPALKINNTTSYSGPNIPLSWNTPSSTGLSGDITYKIYISNVHVDSVVNGNSKTITSGVSSYVNVSIFITATRGGFTSPNSNTVIYSYFNPDKTIGYFNGSTWEDCVIYYYDGSNWVKCNPYYYDGSNWVLCSTK